MKRMVMMLALIIMPLTSRAADCGTGSYIATDGTCTLCEPGYYCPDGNTRRNCASYNSAPYYTDAPGMSECKKCPTGPSSIPDTDITVYYYWIQGNVEHTDMEHCRMRWRVEKPHGTLYIDCPYGTNGYLADNSDCNLLISLQKCDAGYYIDQSNHDLTWGGGDTNIHVYGYSTLLKYDYCTPVPRGYYSPADTCLATKCPDGTTTRTDTAASEAECTSLCTAGATQLKTSNGLSFNIYRDKLTSPALAIGLSKGTCYVPLATGTATNAINIKNGTTEYHTIY